MKQDNKLENNEVKQRILSYVYSSDYKPSAKLVDNIFEQFWFHDFYNSFISDEYVLKILISFLEATQPAIFNRYSFYKYYFETTTPTGLMSKLQQIGLAFEKQQVDAVPEAEYSSILSSLGISEEELGIEVLSRLHLANTGEREDQQLLIWSHHTLTEYLTTSYLLSQDDVIKATTQLVVLQQEGIVAFKPSWTGVLRFLLESTKSGPVLAWLLSFLEQNPDSLDDTMAELLVYTTSKLSSEVRSKLFSLVYNTYFDRLVWLPTWASNDLSRFVGPNEYQHLKSHLKDWPGLTETYVKRGNVIAIVEGLLKDKSGLLTKAELSFWRKTLIQLASHPNDDGNGVIQRHSLGALAYYHDEEIIPLVAKACFDNTNDTLVQDQFMHFCTVTAPESLYTLQYLVKGIKGSSTIYGRYGLYNLKSKKPIKALVKALIDDGEMLKAFLDKESIFDKDSGDQKLYANIDTVIDQSIVSLLKQLVQKLFSSKELYPDNNSPLIRYLAKTILRHDPDYILELVQDIQNQENDDKVLSVFFDYDSFLGLLLTPDNLEKYLKSMDSLPTRVVERKDGPIYTALNANGKIGHDVYEKAIKLGIVQKREELKESPFDVKNRRDKYQEFRGLLEPAPGKYIPSVFQYYINNRETIEKAWSQSEKDRLLKLAIDEGIAKIDPRQIKVKFNDKETRNFTWTSVAAYYGDILQVIKALSPDDISKYRQNIINFIPYAFSDDMSLILELIPTAMDKELSDVNQILLDKKQDVRYLIPSSYIYTVGQYLKKGCIIPGVAKVLRSFIDDEEISIYDRVSALENYESFLISKDKTWLTKIHNNFLKDEAKRDLSYLANELLIRVYLDQKSIDWRFNEVRKPKPFEGYPPLVAHSVGPTEHEFHSMGFAKPLIELKDSKYLPLFIELLDYSFTIQSQHTDDKSYWEYTNYLWRIIIGYLENLSSKGSFRSLLSIEKWAKSHNQIESSNWFISRLHQLRKDYINYLGKVKI